MAVEYLLSSEKAYIVNKMVEIYNSSKNGTTIDVINEMLYGDNGETGLIGDLNSKIQKAIEDKVDEYGNDFKTEISTYISSGTNDAKEYLKGKISDFTSGIAGGSSASIKSSTAAASGFSMTYKEYLKVFFMIHILVSDSNKDAMLIRASELIQANISQKESGFNIGKAYTMVQSSAVVNVRTTFFSVPVSTTDASGNTTYGLDFSNIGSGWQQVKYTSVLGY